MEDQHMTQQVFADFLQQSPATLSSIFNGRTRPTLQVIDAIKSKIPDISIEWLLYGTKIRHVVLPPHVTRIEQQALAGCRNLHRLTIPALVTSLGDSLFIDGTLLDTLILLCANPPEVLESVFPTYDAALIVPCGAANAYRQHPIWGRFADITEDCNAIEDIDSDNIKVYARDGRLIIEGADGETVRIYDMMGREVAGRLLPGGTYLVKIGGRAARKVVVM